MQEIDRRVISGNIFQILLLGIVKKRISDSDNDNINETDEEYNVASNMLSSKEGNLLNNSNFAIESKAYDLSARNIVTLMAKNKINKEHLDDSKSKMQNEINVIKNSYKDLDDESAIGLDPYNSGSNKSLQRQTTNG